MKSAGTDKPVLIVGYGNILRRDDGVGCAAAGLLADVLPASSVTVCTAHQLLPELAEPVSRARLVVFIDADAELPVGTSETRILRPAPPRPKAVGHHQAPEGILQLAADLFDHSPQAILYTIGGADFSYGCDLSAPVAAAVRRLVAEIAATVIAFLEEPEVTRA